MTLGPVDLGGPSPHPLLSVGEGREDEEPVFFFADPAHQLMDGADSRRLGPQGAVAHVELKGTCDLEEGHRVVTQVKPSPIGVPTQDPGEAQSIPGLPYPGQKVLVGARIVDGLEWAGGIVCAAVQVLVEAQQSLLLLFTVVRGLNLRAGDGEVGSQRNDFWCLV